MRPGFCAPILACTLLCCDDAAILPDDAGPRSSRDASPGARDGATAPDGAGNDQDASPGCGDTRSNPSHCGTCAHECAAGTGACVNGACVPAYSPCLTESSGVLTCTGACELLGAVCSLEGCGSSLFGWQLGAEADCESSVFVNGRGRNWPCAEAINWNGPETDIVRCCCAEN